MTDTVEIPNEDPPANGSGSTDCTTSGEPGVLGRWSQRKLSARHPRPLAQEEADGASGSVTSQAGDSAGREPSSITNNAAPNDQLIDGEPIDEIEEPLLTDADMPDIGTLNSDSNISCFFNQGVSEDLRQAAIRYLLRLPAFNIRDGLNDYDEDYTSFEPLGDTVTSDMRFHAERKALLEEQKAALELAETDESETTEITENQDETAEVDEAATPDVESASTEEGDVAAADAEISAVVTNESERQAHEDAVDDPSVQPSTTTFDGGKHT